MLDLTGDKVREIHKILCKKYDIMYFDIDTYESYRTAPGVVYVLKAGMNNHSSILRFTMKQMNTVKSEIRRIKRLFPNTTRDHTDLNILRDVFDSNHWYEDNICILEEMVKLITKNIYNNKQLYKKYKEVVLCK